jgi:LuxR family transcriptional regulator, maltose regulon positive regulatory protein
MIIAQPPARLPASALAPKLHPPAYRSQQVMREALLEKIQCSGGARLVLVCAPAGFGKSTAMGQFRERLTGQGLATAWLTLDGQDNDQSRFLAGLQATLDHLGAQQSAPSQSALSSAGPASIGEWALELIGRCKSLPAPFALFVDDLEAVQDTGVLSLLNELIDHLPRHGQLVLGSRVRPALSLSRLRMRAQLVEIDAGHLRFSILETRQFFADTPIAQSVELLRDLHDKSEGWVAALWLASLALDRSHAGAVLIERFTGSNLALADYLAEDVLAGLDDDLRRFLLCTSVLKHLNPQLCHALLPYDDAAAMLERLAAANLFITPIAGEPGSFRYHALFASFLRDQLAREQPQSVQALHRAAAGWYEAQQRPVPAIDHALEGGDLERALRLLDEHAMPLLMEGRLRLLARWFGELTSGVLQDHPRLYAIGLWALCFTAGPVETSRRLESSGLGRCVDPVVRALVDALPPTLLSMQDRQEEAYMRGCPLLAGLSSGASFADSVLVNVVANAATVLGRHQEARRLLDAGRRAQGGEPSTFSLMYAESVDGTIDLLEGRLRHATARFRLAINPASGTAPALSYAGGNAWAGLLYAATVYESGELDHAAQLLHVYLPLVCNAGLSDHMILGHVMLARIAVCRCDPSHALQMLAKLESLGHQRDLARVVAGARLERARMSLMQGDPIAFDTELSRASDGALWERVARECNLANDLETLALSRLRRAVQVGGADTVPQIERQIAVATATSSYRRVLLLRLLEAMALLRQGEVAPAISRFSLVLKVCTREGFVRLVIDEGPLAGELVQRYLAQEGDARQRDPIVVDHARRLLRAFGPLPAVVDAVQPSGNLTPQELRVLQGVAEGLSNDAMAGQFGVSPSTVRTHLRNISAKLGTQSRTQAVALARRKGWLE